MEGKEKEFSILPIAFFVAMILIFMTYLQHSFVEENTVKNSIEEAFNNDTNLTEMDLNTFYEVVYIFGLYNSVNYYEDEGFTDKKFRGRGGIEPNKTIIVDYTEDKFIAKNVSNKACEALKQSKEVMIANGDVVEGFYQCEDNRITIYNIRKSIVSSVYGHTSNDFFSKVLLDIYANNKVGEVI